MKRKNRHGGAPTKAPGGLTRILFVRISENLENRIELSLKSKRVELGHTISKGDYVRMIIEEYLRPKQ